MTRSQKFGSLLFKYRSFTPLPLIVLVFAFFPPGTWPAIEPWPLVFGLILALAGEAIRVHSCGHAAEGTSGRESTFRADDLNTSGFYSICRNPLYLGNLLLMGGILLVYANPWALLLGMSFLGLQYHFVILAEEYYLGNKYGAEFEAFRDSAPRLLPAPAKWRNPDRPFQGSRVIWQEIDTIFNTIALFIITLAWKAKHTGSAMPARFFLLSLLALTLVYLALKTRKKKLVKKSIQKKRPAGGGP